MHVCIFPNLDNNGPIYGFDVIAGKNKMTGAFHDFSKSSGGEDHPLIDWFKEAVEEYVPSKKRELPQWALNIFSGSMVAAGNVSSEEESKSIVDMALSNLKVYFDSIGEYKNTAKEEDTTEAQNYYCHNQQQNPHTPRVMKSLGLKEEDVEVFCTDALFPKIKTATSTK